MIIENDIQALQNPANDVMREALVKDSKKFLNEFDSFLLHKELYRSLFLYTLECVRDDVVKLLQRFISLPTEPFQGRVVECCGISFKGHKEYTDHYKQVHNLKALQSVTLCELKMALTKMSFYHRTVRVYLKAGEVPSLEMIYYLKQVLKKIDNTLDFD